MTLLATDERDWRNVATGLPRCEHASMEGNKCVGVLSFELGFGGGETKGGTLKSWKWMFEMVFGSQEFWLGDCVLLCQHSEQVCYVTRLGVTVVEVGWDGLVQGKAPQLPPLGFFYCFGNWKSLANFGVGQNFGTKFGSNY